MLHPHSGLLHGQAYRQHWGADRFTCAPWNQDDFSWTNYGMVQLYNILFSWKRTSFSFSHLHRFAPHWATVRAWVVSLVSSKRSAKLCLSQKHKGESPQLDPSPKETCEGVVVGFLYVHMNLLRVFSKGERWVRNWPRQIFMIGWTSSIDRTSLHPWRLTWNLKMMSSKRNLLFQGFIFRSYVSFRWCDWNSTKYIYPWNLEVIYLVELRLPHWGWCRFLCNEPFLWLEFLDLCQHSKGCTTLRRDMKLLSALPKQQMLGWEVMFKDCGHFRTAWLMKKNRSNDLLRRFYFTKSLLKVRWVPIPKKVSQQVQFPGHKVGSVLGKILGFRKFLDKVAVRFLGTVASRLAPQGDDGCGPNSSEELKIWCAVWRGQKLVRFTLKGSLHRFRMFFFVQPKHQGIRIPASFASTSTLSNPIMCQSALVFKHIWLRWVGQGISIESIFKRLKFNVFLWIRHGGFLNLTQNLFWLDFCLPHLRA